MPCGLSVKSIYLALANVKIRRARLVNGPEQDNFMIAAARYIDLAENDDSPPASLKLIRLSEWLHTFHHNLTFDYANRETRYACCREIYRASGGSTATGAERDVYSRCLATHLSSERTQAAGVRSPAGSCRICGVLVFEHVGTTW